MPSLSNIISINVSTLAAAVKQPGFGVILIAGYHTRFAERARSYANVDGILADGFTVNDPEYIAAAAAFAQNPQVQTVLIGRKALPPDLQVDLTPVAANLTVYRVKLRGPTGLTGTASFTSDGTATIAEITAGLTSAINTLALGITATDQTTFVRLKAASAGLWFSAHFVDAAANPTRLLGQAKQTHADPGVATDLAAIKTAGFDFYGVASTTGSSAEIIAQAAWVESNKKFSIQPSQDTDIAGNVGGNVAASIQTSNYERTNVAYHPDPSQFAGIAYMGDAFPLSPGSVTFKFRQLSGVSAVPLSETEYLNLQTLNASSFTLFGSNAITFEGKMASGQFMDVVRDRDWLESRLSTGIFQALLNNNNKIPFTDKGIAVISGVVRNTLEEAVTAGFLAEDPAPTVTAPRASAVSSVDKAARRLKTIAFTGTIAGAVHSTEISGTVTV